MALKVDATHDESRVYYEDFSLQVGLRDWLSPNPRHAQLQRHVDDIMDAFGLAQRAGLRLLDIGCGGGVMTWHLTRFGDVTGTDFSAPAIEAARTLAPEARFIAGDLSTVETDGFDVVTAFDVLEHIPAAQRPEFLAQVRAKTAAGGLVIFSTPYPTFTAARRERNDETLQIIDEEVRLAEVIAEAAHHDLTLVRYHAYDVFHGSPEYQLMAFVASTPAFTSAVLRDHRLRVSRAKVWRLRHAWRLLRSGSPRKAWWFLSAEPPKIRS